MLELERAKASEAAKILDTSSFDRRLDRLRVLKDSDIFRLRQTEISGRKTLFSV